MLIIATGGTFDKDYNLVNGNLHFTHSCVPTLISQARMTAPHQFLSLMQKDSLELTLADRMQILTACRESNSDRIVIVHGTDTMTETARFLQEVISDKTLVLTGAMRPHAFGQSDASFNLGYAIALAQTLAPGVYIAMQGEYFTPNNVLKDKQQAVFVRQS
jgi:L-asparaginase